MYIYHEDIISDIDRRRKGRELLIAERVDVGKLKPTFDICVEGIQELR